MVVFSSVLFVLFIPVLISGFICISHLLFCLVRQLDFQDHVIYTSILSGFALVVKHTCNEPISAL